MKHKKQIIIYLIISLILISNLVNFECRRLLNKAKNSNKSKERKSYLPQWGKGFLTSMGGGDGHSINECLPEKMKSADLAEDNTSDTALDQFVQTEGSKLATLTKGLKIAIKATCIAIHAPIKKLMSVIHGGHRRLKRMFIQKKKGIKEKLAEIKKKTKEHFLETRNKIKDHLHRVTEELQRNEVYCKVRDKVNAFAKKVHDFFNRPVIVELRNKLENCGKTIINLAVNIKNVIKGITVVSSTGGIVLPGMVSSVVCSYEQFERAVEYLKEAIKETEPTKKWVQIGKFSGQMLVLFGICAPLADPVLL